MNRKDKKEDGDSGSGSIDFQSLDKTTVLQESRYFNSSSLVARKCIKILTKILFFLNQGKEELTDDEATEMFFAVTKLFQLKDVALRRLVYLCIKELRTLVKDTIILTSSLTADMTGQEDKYRAAAIRALCSITDTSMLQGIERYMKQAILDKNPAVSSAALVSALHLSSKAPDFVQSLLNEAQDAIMSCNAMVSYHALALVAHARSSDPLSMVTLLTKYSSTALRSPFGVCHLIRHISQLVESGQNCDIGEVYIKFIEKCLTDKSEIVIYEAAHALINFKKPTKGLPQAVSVMQMFCESPKAALRLAGARTLSNVCIRHPSMIVGRALYLESLVSDPNCTIAIFALTTLLASGPESSIEKILKQIVVHLSEISEQLKIPIVHSIKGLINKYPQKHEPFGEFLATMLKEKGGKEFKSAIMEALITLVETNPDARENILTYLCDYVEVSEHSVVTICILQFLSREGPKAQEPARCIRYIYNRVMIESSAVRAAAISAIARFGAVRLELLPNIMVLLERCHSDENEEIRDRAVKYSAILESQDEKLINDYIIDVPSYDPVRLDQLLSDFILTDKDLEQPLNIESAESASGQTRDGRTFRRTLSREEKYAQQLKKIPGIDTIGTVFRICEPIELSEPGTECHVVCLKLIYSRHIILHFECMNTVNIALLQNVRVRLDCLPGYKIISEITCDQLLYNKQGDIYFLLQYPQGCVETLGSFSATLEFFYRDCDPITAELYPCDGYDDIYALESIVIGCSEQFKLLPGGDDWLYAWERSAKGHEISDTFRIPQSDVGEAAKAVCDKLGLAKHAITGDSVKEIRGGGLFRAFAPVFIKARLVDTQGTVTMYFTARSTRKDIATLLLIAVG